MDPVSLTIFSIVVEKVVRAMLLEVCRKQEAHNGLVWDMGENNMVFYADNNRIVGRKHIWIQTTLTAVVRMFERARLKNNPSQNKSVFLTTCLF